MRSGWQKPRARPVTAVFTTQCGHTATARVVEKKGGQEEGNWQIRLNGPKVVFKRGYKCLYSALSLQDAKERVALWLKEQETNINGAESKGAKIKPAEKTRVQTPARIAGNNPTGRRKQGNKTGNGYRQRTFRMIRTLVEAEGENVKKVGGTRFTTPEGIIFSTPVG